MKKITEEFIRQKLQIHYTGRDNKDRILMKVKIGREKEMDTHGAIIYALDGSPPKGYAIHIPGHHMLNLYDLEGRRFKIYYNVELKNE